MQAAVPALTTNRSVTWDDIPRGAGLINERCWTLEPILPYATVKLCDVIEKQNVFEKDVLGLANTAGLIFVWLARRALLFIFKVLFYKYLMKKPQNRETKHLFFPAVQNRTSWPDWVQLHANSWPAGSEPEKPWMPWQSPALIGTHKEHALSLSDPITACFFLLWGTRVIANQMQTVDRTSKHDVEL